MRVRTVQGGDLAASVLIYPPPDNNLLNYLNTNLQQAKQAMGDIGSSFMDTASTLYEKYNGSEILNAGKQLLYSIGSHMNQNVIVPVTYEMLPEANYAMQGYIMEQPELNKLYHQNAVNGYDATYIDPEPGIVGKNRLGYQQVMNGVLQFENTDEELGYIEYYNNSEDIEELELYEQLSILKTWDNVALALANDLDPTTLEEM